MGTFTPLQMLDRREMYADEIGRAMGWRTGDRRHCSMGDAVLSDAEAAFVCALADMPECHALTQWDFEWLCEQAASGRELGAVIRAARRLAVMPTPEQRGGHHSAARPAFERLCA